MDAWFLQIQRRMSSAGLRRVTSTGDILEHHLFRRSLSLISLPMGGGCVGILFRKFVEDTCRGKQKAVLEVQVHMGAFSSVKPEMS